MEDAMPLFTGYSAIGTVRGEGTYKWLDISVLSVTEGALNCQMLVIKVISLKF